MHTQLGVKPFSQSVFCHIPGGSERSLLPLLMRINDRTLAEFGRNPVMLSVLNVGAVVCCKVQGGSVYEAAARQIVVLPSVSEVQ